MGEVPAAGRAQGQDQVAQALLPEERPRRRARLGGAGRSLGADPTAFLGPEWSADGLARVGAVVFDWSNN